MVRGAGVAGPAEVAVRIKCALQPLIKRYG